MNTSTPNVVDVSDREWGLVDSKRRERVMYDLAQSFEFNGRWVFHFDGITYKTLATETLTAAGLTVDK